MPPVVVVGRREECALLGSSISGVAEESAAWLVTGEAGIGKTTLIEGALGGLAREVRLLRVAAAPHSRHVASLGIGALVAGESPAVDDQVAPSLAAGYAESAGRILRALASEATPATVLVLEDLHWADPLTLDLSARLCRNLPSQGLVIVMAWRDDEQWDPDHEAWLAEQRRNPFVHELALRRFCVEETVEQVRGLLGRSSSQLGQQIHQHSNGNPYLTAELAASGGALSSSLRQVLGNRLAVCSEAERAAVAAAGTLGRPVDDDLLVAAVAGDTRAIRRAVAAGVLVREAAGATPRHPLLGALAYEQLLEPERRAMHDRLARHLEAGVAPTARPAAVAEVAEQHRRAGHVDDALVWAVRAADASASEFALAQASHWYSLASLLWDQAPTVRPLVPDPLVLACRAARLLNHCGAHAQALGVLNHALDRSPASTEVVPALLIRSWLRTITGETQESVNDAERALALTPPSETELLGRGHAQLALALGTASRWTEAEPHTQEALKAATAVDDRATLATALMVRGGTENALGNWVPAVAALERSLTIATELGEPDLIALAAAVLTDTWLRAGETDKVVQVATAVRAQLRRLSPARHWLEGMIEGNTAEVLFHAGRWHEADRWIADAPESYPLASVVFPATLMALERHQTQTAEEWLSRIEVIDRDSQPQFKSAAATLLSRSHLLAGRPAEALEVALAAARILHGTTDEASAELLLLTALEAAAVLRRPDQVASVTALLAATTTSRFGEAVRAEVAGAEHRSQGAPAAECCAEAAAAWHRLGRPVQEGWARLRLCEALLAGRSKGARAEAAGQLALAARIADRLGASVLHEHVRDLARLARIRLAEEQTQSATGDAPPGAFGTLTEREARVLALLTQGLTNRQIGAELYISPKTASVHVTHILAKLGVQTRVEAAAMSAHRPPA